MLIERLLKNILPNKNRYVNHYTLLKTTTKGKSTSTSSSTSSTSTTTVTNSSEILYGDVYNPGDDLNTTDVVTILTFYSGTISSIPFIPETKAKRGDINEDVRITVVDASLIFAYCADLAGKVKNNINRAAFAALFYCYLFRLDYRISRIFFKGRIRSYT